MSGEANIGFNLYVWDMEAQNRALRSHIAPAVAALRTAGDLDFFWFDRDDLRGPHLYMVASAPESRREAAEQALRRAVEQALAESPSTLELDAEHLQARHDACYERFRSDLDAEPGFEADNTLRDFSPRSGSVPFSWHPSILADGAFQRRLTELALWAVDHLGEDGKPASLGHALYWLADLDRALGDSAASKSYWTYHLGCDIPGFKRVLAAGEGQAAVMAERKIGDKNRSAFEPLWRLGEIHGPSWQPMPDFVRSAVDPSAEAPEKRWFLLREIVHSALKQMGLKVRDHILLGLYAWSVHHPAPERVSEVDSHA